MTSQLEQKYYELLDAAKHIALLLDFAIADINSALERGELGCDKCKFFGLHGEAEECLVEPFCRSQWNDSTNAQEHENVTEFKYSKLIKTFDW